MKKLLLMAGLCLLVSYAQAQIANLTITNNRPCPVRVVFTGDNAACGPTASSTGVILIPASFSGVVTTGSYAWLGSTPPYFISVRVIDRPATGCGVPASLFLGEICSSYPGTGTLGTMTGSPCTICTPSTATIDWVNTGSNNGTLTFNP